MARPARGTVEYRQPKHGPGRWWGRITLIDGSRPWVDLGDWPNSPQGRARAQESAAHQTERARELGVVSTPKKRKGEPAPEQPPGETFDAYAVRWFADREARGLSSLSTDRSRIRVHVSPTLGDKPMAEIEAADLRAVCRHLDETARTDPGFSWRTAVKVWGLVTKLFNDACESKLEALRVLQKNPCAGVRGPDRGKKKGKQWLYPSEVARLAACPHVPLRWRRLYVLASYLYLRPGELAALEWADVNLADGYVLIHQSLNLEADEIKGTKTGTTRRVPIRPALAPLLEAMKAEAGGVGHVVQHTHDNKLASHGMPPTEDLAATLREHLQRAGIERAELYAKRSTTKRVTFYDLRASGITWEVLAGTEHVRIMQRAGHENFSTTKGYIREAEALGENVGEPFGPLCDSLLSAQCPGVSSNESSCLAFVGPFTFGSSTIFTGLLASPRGFERGRTPTFTGVSQAFSNDRSGRNRWIMRLSPRPFRSDRIWTLRSPTP